jgi:hypothetical protein
MAYQKLQSREALAVIPNDTVRIPDPSSIVVLDSATGATVSTVGNFGSITLDDATAKFTEVGIKQGMIVYNTTSGLAWTVVSVNSDTQLSIVGSVAGGASDSYSIYARPTIGCTLFIGTAGDVNVRMAEQNGNTTTAAAPANQFVLYKNIANGSFLPIQVVQVKVTSTDASNIVAMW